MHTYTHTCMNTYTFVPYSTKSNIVCTAFPVPEIFFLLTKDFESLVASWSHRASLRYLILETG